MTSHLFVASKMNEDRGSLRLTLFCRPQVRRRIPLRSFCTNKTSMLASTTGTSHTKTI